MTEKSNNVATDVDMVTKDEKRPLGENAQEEVESKDERNTNAEQRENKEQGENNEEHKDDVYVKGDKKTQIYRLSKTWILFLSWVCLGMFNEVVGPTLPDIKARVGADYEEIARVLAARSAGLFLGSLFGGVLIDRFTQHRDLALAVSLVISGTTISVAPHVGTLWLLGIVFHFMGHGHGLQTTGGNPSLAALWLDKAAGPYNFLHSGFGFGAAIAPLIAEPFLLDDVNITSSNNSDHNINLTTFTVSGSEVSRIEFPYGIVGGICYFTAVCFFVYYLLRKKTPQALVPKQQKKIASIFDPKTCAGGDRAFGIQMFILIFLYYMLLVGGERAYGKFVYSYARESDLRFNKKEAAWLNTLYWVSFTLARVVAYIIARWVPIHILLFIQVSGTAASAILLNIFHSNTIGFWIITFAFGFFKAPLFPSGLGWINRYLNVTSMLIMVVNIGSSTGGMFIQWLTGYLFEYYGPRSFLYTILTYSLLLFCMFTVMYIVGRRHGERFDRKEKEPEEHKEDEMVALAGNGQIAEEKI